MQHTIERLRTERARTAAEFGQPFPHTDALATVTARSAQLDDELAEQASLDRAPVTATERWQPAVPGLPDGQRILDDPHWSDLADALTRLQRPDHDATAHLAQLAADPLLDQRHPAADLHDRMLRDYLLAVPQEPQPATRDPAPPEQPPSPNPAAGVGR